MQRADPSLGLLKEKEVTGGDPTGEPARDEPVGPSSLLLSE